jgi:hypothetical protein
MKISLVEVAKNSTIKGIASLISVIDWAYTQKPGAAVNQVKEEVII